MEDTLNNIECFTPETRWSSLKCFLHEARFLHSFTGTIDTLCFSEMLVPDDTLMSAGLLFAIGALSFSEMLVSDGTLISAVSLFATGTLCSSVTLFPDGALRKLWAIYTKDTLITSGHSEFVTRCKRKGTCLTRHTRMQWTLSPLDTLHVLGRCVLRHARIQWTLSPLGSLLSIGHSVLRAH